MNLLVYTFLWSFDHYGKLLLSKKLITMNINIRILISNLSWSNK